MPKINIPTRGVGGANPNVPTTEVQAAQYELRREQQSQQAILQAGQAIAGITQQVMREREIEKGKESAAMRAKAIGDLDTFIAQSSLELTREELQAPDGMRDEETVMSSVQRRLESITARRDQLAESINDEDERAAFVNTTNSRIGAVYEEGFLRPALRMFDAAQADLADAEIDALSEKVFTEGSPLILKQAIVKAQNDPRLNSQERGAAVERVQATAFKWYSTQLRGDGAFGTALKILGSPGADLVNQVGGSGYGTLQARAQEVLLQEFNPSSGGSTMRELRSAQDMELENPGAFETAAQTTLDQIAAAGKYLPDSMKGRLDMVKLEIEQTREELKAARQIASHLAAGNEMSVNTNTRVGKLASNMDWTATLEAARAEPDMTKQADMIVRHWQLAGASEGSVGYILSLNPVYDQSDAVMLGLISDRLERVRSPRRAEVGRAVVNAMRRYGEDDKIMRMVRAVDPEAARQLEERAQAGSIRVADLDALAILSERGNLLDAQKMMLGGQGRAKSYELDITARLTQDGLEATGDLMDKSSRLLQTKIQEWLKNANVRNDYIQQIEGPRGFELPDGGFGGRFVLDIDEVAAELAPQIAPSLLANYSGTSLSLDQSISMTLNEALATATQSQFRAGKVGIDAPDHYFDGAWDLFKLENKVGDLRELNIDYMKIHDYAMAGTDENGLPYYNIWLEGEGGPSLLMDPERPSRPYQFVIGGGEDRLAELTAKWKFEQEQATVDWGLGKNETLGKLERWVDDKFEARKEYWSKRRPIANEPGALRTEENNAELSKQLTEGAYPVGASLKPLVEITRNQLDPKRRPTRQSGIGMFDDPAPSDADWPAFVNDEQLTSRVESVLSAIDERASSTKGFMTVRDDEAWALIRWTEAMKAGNKAKRHRYESTLRKEVESGKLEQRDADELLATFDAKSQEYQHDLDWTRQQLDESFDYFTVHRAFDSQEDLSRQIRAAQLTADYIGYRRALGLGTPMRENEDGTPRLPTAEELDEEIRTWIERGGLIDWRGIKSGQ